MIIYKSENKVNGKIYIGQTIQDFDKRKYDHIHPHQYYYFQHAILKHGENNFNWSIIDTAKDLDELNLKEQYWIKFYNCLSPNGYNLTSGGKNTTLSDETRKKIGLAGVGRKHSKETKIKMSQSAKNISFEVKQNRGKSLKGRKFSPDTIEKMSLSKKNKPGPRLGMHCSDEMKKKISDTKKGTRLSEETKEKCRQASLGDKNPNFGKRGELSPIFGRKHTEEEKEKISLSHKGKKRSEESRERMRLAQIKRWEMHKNQSQLNQGLCFDRGG